MNPFVPDMLMQLAARDGTPFYIYHWPTVERQVRRLAAAVGDATRILYSMKANPNPLLVGRLAGLVAGVEVASMGELQLALAAGVKPERIFFTSPAKSDEEFELAANTPLLAVGVDSPAQAMRLDRISGRAGVRRDVVLRVNPMQGIAGARMSMGGLPGQFGVDQEQAGKILHWMATLGNVRCVGIHVYAGTQVLDGAALGEYLGRTIELGMQFARAHGLSMINIGGGFGVPHHPGQQELDLGLAAGAIKAFDEKHGTSAGGRISLYVESGRFLVAQCGCYVAKVLDVKESRGSRFVMLDGGTNHLLAVGGLDRTIRVNPSFRVVGRESDAAAAPATVVGPLCSSADRLADNANLPADLAAGDLVAVENVGAYGRSASQLNFLSRDWPAEYLVTGNSRCIRISSGISAMELWGLQKPAVEYVL
ncbi:MAG: pyridoxal-dependent decarboxylase, exosortase A system-associated [Phycisphaerae bacterium]|jgi:diaminopimelate decarboxylase